jgi:hypothetical protein
MPARAITLAMRSPSWVAGFLSAGKANSSGDE